MPRLPALLGLAVALAATAVIVAAQPVTSPWWTYADADASYTASGLNLLHGTQVRYLDHPGLPLEELIAAAFGVRYAAARVTGSPESHTAFVDRQMLHLDETRSIFRGLAIAFYAAGALLAFVLLGRLFGHWTWGLAGGLAWIAAPGLAGMSIQYRPDVALSVLTLVFAYLLIRALQTRSALLYAAAALELGFTVMVKMHAAGLVVPLAIAAIWRPPGPGWPSTSSALVSDWLRRRRLWVGAGVVVWLGAAVPINYQLFPFSPTRDQLVAVLAPLLLIAAYTALGLAVGGRGSNGLLRRVFDPVHALIASALLAGLALPMTFDIPDGMRSFVYVFNGLTGRGINEGIPLFGASLRQLLETPLREALVFFGLAGIAAVVGALRREPLPVVCFAGAAVLGVMADARLAAVHYFAPAFVMSLPGAFWLLRRGRGWRSTLLVWPLLVYAILPQLENRNGPERSFEAFRAAQEPSLQFVAERLRPGEVGLTPNAWPHPDVRYFDFVEPYVFYSPDYPYRFLSTSERVLALAKDRGLRFRYYIGPDTEKVLGTRRMTIGALGEFTVRRVGAAPQVVELLAGPLVARP